MSVEEIARGVKELGFPAAIAFFVLWRVDRRLAELIIEVRTLHGSIRALLGIRPQ